MNFDRFWEVAKRNFNPLKGANKPKLIELDRLLQKIGPSLKNAATLNPTDWVHAQFNFAWIKSLTDNEFQEFRGTWISCFQSAARSDPSQKHRFAAANPHHFAIQVSDVERKRMLQTSTISEFWDGLQFVKEKYRKIATDRSLNWLQEAMQYVQKLKSDASDWVFRNEWFGQYAAKADLVNNIYDDAACNGPQSDVENKLLVAGGLWRVVKTTLSVVFHAAFLHEHIHPLKTLNKSIGALNALAGMVAGLTDMFLGKNPNFQPLSGRLGIDSTIERYKKKYLGPGLQQEGDSLRQQMEDGPARLTKSSDITIYDLDKVRDQIKRSLWWCKIWEKDIQELKRDLSDHGQSAGIFRDVEEAVGREAMGKVTMLNAEIGLEKAKQKERVEDLEAKVRGSKMFYGKRLETINDLLAASETRLSLARTQAKSAAAGHSFDILRQIAVEASQFDRGKLKSAAPVGKPARTVAPATKRSTRETLLQEIEQAAQQSDRTIRLDTILSASESTLSAAA